MWEKLPSGGTPPLLLPPVWETPVIKEKSWFIFHFRTSGTFLVVTKKSQFLGMPKITMDIKKWVWVRPPHPQFGNFSHKIPFFSDRVAYVPK